MVVGCTRLGKENEPFSWLKPEQEVVLGVVVVVVVGGVSVFVVAVNVAALQLLTMAKRSQSS